MDQAKSAVRLPSDLALQTSLDVLEKTNEAGGVSEIGAIVGKKGQVLIGEPGPPATENTTVLGASLSDYDFPMSEVEASIHSHMTECLIFDSGLIKYSEANIAGPKDPEVFSQYDCNIIVGKRGAPFREDTGTTDIHGRKIYKCGDYRKEGIGIFGRNTEEGKEAPLWLNKEAVLKIINYGKTQE